MFLKLTVLLGLQAILLIPASAINISQDNNGPDPSDNMEFSSEFEDFSQRFEGPISFKTEWKNREDWRSPRECGSYTCSS